MPNRPMFTYLWPHRFSVPYFIYNAWRKKLCTRGFHLFDEVFSYPDENYLNCDACGLVVNIADVDETWVGIEDE